MSAAQLGRGALAAAGLLSLAGGLLSGVLYAIEPQAGPLLRMGGCGLAVIVAAVLWRVTDASGREDGTSRGRLLLLSSVCLLLAVAILGGLTAKQLLESREPRTASRGEE